MNKRLGLKSSPLENDAIIQTSQPSDLGKGSKICRSHPRFYPRTVIARPFLVAHILDLFKAISEKRNMNKIYVSWNPPSIPVRKYTVTVTDNTNDKSLNYNIAGSASIRLKFKYFV